MLQAIVEQHDRFQVEFKVSYPLPEKDGSRNHAIELFFFVPGNLGIRRSSYSKDQFYADLQSYLRLTTPVVPLDRFTTGSESPVAKLRASIENAGIRNVPEPPRSYERGLKLFCSILKSAVRDFAAEIMEADDPDDRAQLAMTFVECLQNVCHEYRSLSTTIHLPGVAERTSNLYLFGDEWLSLLVESSGYQLLEDLKWDANDAGFPELLALVDGELQYRKKKGYPSIPDEQSDNETLVFRRSVLKKYMASILFLQAKVRKEGQFLQQTLFGVSAGVAMFFATAVAFVTQSVYGALTPAFFAALVVSYIFKDRLKELLRVYLWRRLGNIIFDQKTVIRDAAERSVGVCRESFEFLAERRIPDAIRNLRDRDHITEIENSWLGEKAFVYKKHVRLAGQAARKIFVDYEVRGVTDIMRFSVREFLRRMDDPKKGLFVLDDDGYQPIKGARVYHISLIMRLCEKNKEDLRRYRIVLNRKGIKRVEFVHGTENSLSEAELAVDSGVGAQT